MTKKGLNTWIQKDKQTNRQKEKKKQKDKCWKRQKTSTCKITLFQADILWKGCWFICVIFTLELKTSQIWIFMSLLSHSPAQLHLCRTIIFGHWSTHQSEGRRIFGRSSVVAPALSMLLLLLPLLGFSLLASP